MNNTAEVMPFAAAVDEPTQTDPAPVSYSLTEKDAAIVKAMIIRGDLFSDIAEYFCVNRGRISEINTGARFANVNPLGPNNKNLPEMGPRSPRASLEDAGYSVLTPHAAAEGEKLLASRTSGLNYWMEKAEGLATKYKYLTDDHQTLKGRLHQRTDQYGREQRKSKTLANENHRHALYIHSLEEDIADLRMRAGPWTGFVVGAVVSAMAVSTYVWLIMPHLG